MEALVLLSVVTPPTLHGIPSAQESSAYEPPTQFALISPQPTAHPSDSSSVDSRPVDSSLPFRTSELDPSPQTRFSPKTFFSLGSQSGISYFKRKTISNELFDLALLIAFELVRNGNLISPPFDPGGPVDIIKVLDDGLLANPHDDQSVAHLKI
ncbi:hypothetical protein Dimus_003482 [Dionaea muscipula]